MSVDGPYQINCDGQIGGAFVWNSCGLELTFPPKCSKQNIEITMSALLPVRNEVHPGVYMVSAVFKFHCNVKKFDKDFTLHLQHCINIKSSEDCHNMCFIIQHGNASDIKYGHFEAGDSYGSIALNKFCRIAVACIPGVLRNLLFNFGFITNNQNKEGNSSQIIDKRPSRIDSEISLDKGTTPKNNHKVSCSLGDQQCNSQSADIDEWKKDQEDINKADFPCHKYEEMFALPKDHSKLTKWIGIYSVYVKKAAWRIVSIHASSCMLLYSYVRIYILIFEIAFYTVLLYIEHAQLLINLVFQASIKSMQTDNITFPFNVYVREIEFDSDGVATITSVRKDSTTWYINCWPEEVC